MAQKFCECLTKMCKADDYETTISDLTDYQNNTGKYAETRDYEKYQQDELDRQRQEKIRHLSNVIMTYFEIPDTKNVFRLQKYKPLTINVEGLNSDDITDLTNSLQTSGYNYTQSVDGKTITISTQGMSV